MQLEFTPVDKFHQSLKLDLASQFVSPKTNDRKNGYVLIGSTGASRAVAMATAILSLGFYRIHGFYYHIVCEDEAIYDAVLATIGTRTGPLEKRWDAFSKDAWAYFPAANFNNFLQAVQRKLGQKLLVTVGDNIKGGHEHIVVALRRSGVTGRFKNDGHGVVHNMVSNLKPGMGYAQVLKHLVTFGLA